ncbi:ankyrin repeat-containing domain protein [Fusarium venenatum]|uniref:ankyrin repeat-containing domain protein n=1 Tax=Fusarium venenatum TaxID=56646 RepID=UPI001DA2605F|nr:ankyrin repeat-containing domain protein [Fusarium venenatum]
MFHAARKGHGDIVQLLLRTPGNDPIAEDKHGYTALAYATLHGYEDVVRILLEYDHVQDDSKAGDPGKTPLSIAYQFGHHSIAQLLRTYPMTNIVDIVTGSREADNDANAHNVTSLWWSAFRGNHLLVRELLRHRVVELNFRDANDGRTALWCAAAEGHEAVVEPLLREQGIDLESKNTEDGQTALCVAARFGHRGVSKIDVRKQEGCFRLSRPSGTDSVDVGC